MKLKYFLRGLASGVVVTTIILSIANGTGKENALTEEQIIQKAKELGMVEAGKEKVSPTPKGTITPKPNVTVEVTEIIQEEEEQMEEPTVTPEATATPKPEATATSEPEATATPEPEATATEAPKSEVQNTQEVTITISSGMWSDSVASRLEALGAVDSATKFDQYLVANGYAERLVVGTYQIPAGSSYEQIANIITRR